MTTQNPILPGFNPDPSICRVGEDYFLATSTFEFFPGIPIYHSKDLINWRLIGHALNRPSQLWMRSTSHGDGVYAPTLRYWKYRWYLATSCVTDRENNIHGATRGFCVSTDDIWDESRWTEPTYLDMVGIDQDLFFEDDDKVYLCTARLNGGKRQPTGAKLSTYCAQIDLDTGRCITRPRLLCHSTQPGPISGIAEGPHIFKRDGYYYLFVAECGPFDNHQERVYRSTHALGPYTDPGPSVNPILFQPNSDHIQRAGHADLVEGVDGKWWAVFLGVRKQDGVAQLGRETFLCPVQWSETGWPTCNNGKEVTLSLADMPPRRDEVWCEKWNELSPGWYHLRTPVKKEYSLTLRPGHLALYGNMYTIQSKECPAMLLRKQTSLTGTWETSLEFEPENEYEEAGTAVYLLGASYIAMLIRQKAGVRQIVLQWIDEQHTLKEMSRPLANILGPIALYINAQPTSYAFSFRQTDLVEWATMPTSILVRPSETTFTGTHFALFAQGTDGEPNLTPAIFGMTSFKPETST